MFESHRFPCHSKIVMNVCAFLHEQVSISYRRNFEMQLIKFAIDSNFEIKNKKYTRSHAHLLLVDSNVSLVLIPFFPSLSIEFVFETILHCVNNNVNQTALKWWFFTLDFTNSTLQRCFFCDFNAKQQLITHHRWYFHKIDEGVRKKMQTQR